MIVIQWLLLFEAICGISATKDKNPIVKYAKVIVAKICEIQPELNAKNSKKSGKILFCGVRNSGRKMFATKSF